MFIFLLSFLKIKVFKNFQNVFHEHQCRLKKVFRIFIETLEDFFTYSHAISWFHENHFLHFPSQNLVHLIMLFLLLNFFQYILIFIIEVKVFHQISYEVIIIIIAIYNFFFFIFIELVLGKIHLICLI